MKTDSTGFPVKQGLYDPAYEKASCGVGFVVSIDGVSSHQVSFSCFYCEVPNSCAVRNNSVGWKIHPN